MISEQKLDYVKRTAKSVYKDSMTREEVMAYSLYNRGVTEGEFLEMQGMIDLSRSIIVKIANVLREIERKEKEKLFNKE